MSKAIKSLLRGMGFNTHDCPHCKRNNEARKKLLAELEKPEPTSDAVKILCKRYGTSLAKIATDLEAENEQLKEENRWIPVSERLPEAETINLALLESGNIVQVCDADWDTPSSGRQNARIKHSLEKITHWKPIVLPEQALKDRK